MGDRAHCVVKEGDEQIYLYTHWRGSDLCDIVRVAMRRVKGRWDDAPYLARAIFCELVQDQVMEETGFGIWCKPVEAINRDVLVDVKAQTVTPRPNRKPVTFEEFVAGKGGH